MRKFWSVAVLLLSLAIFTACSMGNDTAALKADVAENYANIVHASYEDSYNEAVKMQTAINAFVAAPSEETLAAAKAAWLAAREPYGQTEAYRFYGGPIDDEDGPEGLINSWPMDEAFVDYVEGAPDSGIINDPATYPEITGEVILGLNQADSEESVSTGYHAIEFLLWGQDLNEDGPGSRPYTDYVEGGTAPNPERRAAYLVAVTELLLEHLAQVRDEWAPNTPGNYRETFLALPPDEAIQQMMTGIGVLAKSELAGERIFTAYDNQDQEDEHSCFSDNTHRDIYNNALGVQNVYLGQYRRVDGTTIRGASLKDLVATADSGVSTELETLLAESLAKANAVLVPFDQAIVQADARPAVLETVNALQDSGDKIAEAAGALDIQINTALPE
jgi:putative iron-regulated protein